MTTALTSRPPLDLSGREYNNLTVIDGIGSKTLPKLEEQGIRTLQDLAEISDDRIKTVATKINGVTEEKLKKWRSDAQKLLSQRSAKPLESEGGNTSNSPTTEGEWKPFAALWVEFQRREAKGQAERQRIAVSHMPVEHGAWLEEKRTEPKIVQDSEELCQWMQEQIGEKVPQGTEPLKDKPQEEVQPATSRPVTMEIAQIKAFQPSQNETPAGIGTADQPFSGLIRSGEPFALEVSFGLDGPGADDIVKKRTTYNTQFYVRDRTTDVKKYLGDTGPTPLIEDKLSSYKSRLTGITLQSGLYRLRVIVMLQDTCPIMGYLEVPMLQVV